MDETATPLIDDFQRRQHARRRAKRGLVAGYLHELSGRRNGNGAAPHKDEDEKDPIDLADAKGD
jgi:hypothetical protein